VARCRAIVGNLYLTAPSLAQHAALAAMDATEELEANVAVYRKNRELILRALPLLGLAEIAPPDGAFYIWADVGHLTSDSLALCQQLLRDTGVATAPGVDFDPEEGGRFIRFSFAVSTAEVQEAIRRCDQSLASSRLILRLGVTVAYCTGSGSFLALSTSPAPGAPRRAYGAWDRSRCACAAQLRPPAGGRASHSFSAR
jgi:hypothetical protein